MSPNTTLVKRKCLKTKANRTEDLESSTGSRIRTAIGCVPPLNPFLIVVGDAGFAKRFPSIADKNFFFNMCFNLKIVIVEHPITLLDFTTRTMPSFPKILNPEVGYLLLNLSPLLIWILFTNFTQIFVDIVHFPQPSPLVFEERYFLDS